MVSLTYKLKKLLLEIISEFDNRSNISGKNVVHGEKIYIIVSEFTYQNLKGVHLIPFYCYRLYWMKTMEIDL